MRRFDDECGPEAGALSHFEVLKLQVRDRDREVVRNLRIPDQPHVGEVQDAQRSLLLRQVPHVVAGADHALSG